MPFWERLQRLLRKKQIWLNKKLKLIRLFQDSILVELMIEAYWDRIIGKRKKPSNKGMILKTMIMRFLLLFYHLKAKEVHPWITILANKSSTISLVLKRSNLINQKNHTTISQFFNNIIRILIDNKFTSNSHSTTKRINIIREVAATIQKATVTLSMVPIKAHIQCKGKTKVLTLCKEVTTKTRVLTIQLQSNPTTTATTAMVTWDILGMAVMLVLRTAELESFTTLKMLLRNSL